MGICSSIPKITMQSVRIVADYSGYKKHINTTFYKNYSISVSYAGNIPLRMHATVNNTIFKTDEIIHIHTVKGNGDSLIETLDTVYIISAAVNFKCASDDLLERTETSHTTPLLSI